MKRSISYLFFPTGDRLESQLFHRNFNNPTLFSGHHRILEEGNGGCLWFPWTEFSIRNDRRRKHPPGRNARIPHIR